jgi:hypothetical protein
MTRLFRACSKFRSVAKSPESRFARSPSHAGRHCTLPPDAKPAKGVSDSELVEQALTKATEIAEVLDKAHRRLSAGECVSLHRSCPEFRASILPVLGCRSSIEARPVRTRTSPRPSEAGIHHATKDLCNRRDLAYRSFHVLLCNRHRIGCHADSEIDGRACAPR